MLSQRLNSSLNQNTICPFTLHNQIFRILSSSFYLHPNIHSTHTKNAEWITKSEKHPINFLIHKYLDFSIKQIAMSLTLSSLSNYILSVCVCSGRPERINSLLIEYMFGIFCMLCILFSSCFCIFVTQNTRTLDHWLLPNPTCLRTRKMWKKKKREKCRIQQMVQQNGKFERWTFTSIRFDTWSHALAWAYFIIHNMKNMRSNLHTNEAQTIFLRLILGVRERDSLGQNGFDEEPTHKNSLYVLYFVYG